MRFFQEVRPSSFSGRYVHATGHTQRRPYVTHPLIAPTPQLSTLTVLPGEQLYLPTSVTSISTTGTLPFKGTPPPASMCEKKTMELFKYNVYVCSSKTSLAHGSTGDWTCTNTCSSHKRSLKKLGDAVLVCH